MIDKFLLEVKAKLEWEFDNKMSKKVRKFNNKPPVVYGDCPMLTNAQQEVVSNNTASSEEDEFEEKPRWSVDA